MGPQNVLSNFDLISTQYFWISTDYWWIASKWKARWTWCLNEYDPLCVSHFYHTENYSSDIHYSDVIMGAMASQVTGVSIVYSTVYSGADPSLAFVKGIHRWPVNSPDEEPVTRKCFHLMTSSWIRRAQRRGWRWGWGHKKPAALDIALSLYINQTPPHTISPEGYELWHPHNWPVTTTNHLPPHLANYMGHQRVSVFV